MGEACWEIEGQLLEASNAVFRMRAGLAQDKTDQTPRAVYKPVRGERPLADFPDGTLAHREVATYLVAQAGGWSCIPETSWYDGAFGPGSLQRWVGPLDGDEQSRVSLVAPEDLGEQTDLALIAAFETEAGPVILAHDMDEDLAALAALDVVTNNADRKGSHLIEDDAHTWAIDNGLTFHTDDKLRTVLWGFAGQPLPERVIAHLNRLVDAREPLAKQLDEHLTGPEIQQFHARTDALLAAGEFPEPPEERYGLPWPPL